MDAAVDRVSSQLGLTLPTPEPDEEPDAVVVPPTGPVTTATVTPVPASPSATPPVTTTPTPVGRQVPKSWPKEMHEHWGKLDPKMQDYTELREKQMLDGLEQYKTDAQMAKQFQSVIQPFQPILQAQGLNAPQAVQYLLNAHQRLTQGAPESRQAAYDELGRSLGLGSRPTAPAAEPSPVDPALQALQQQMAQIQSGLTAQQQKEYQAAQARTSQEVEAFASDPAHPHFNEIADDIVLLLKTGLSLQESYDKAMWANPLTREMNLQARLTSETEKQKENARLQALPKAKAARNNVRSIESRRTPTESLGSMEDTIKATLQDIKQRVH
jgi:hypothetical protein